MEENSSQSKGSQSLTGRSFSINSDKDLVTIREYGRKLAKQVGFENNDQTLIATALSEICRNVLEYAGSGRVVIKPDRNRRADGLTITVSDNGPGIEDVNKALQEGYSTGRGMGVGLPGTMRIMDDFSIRSTVGKGTTVTMRKWLEHYDF